VGHGKKSTWATWNSFPEMTYSLVTLINTPVSIQDDTMHCFERFVVLPYGRTGPYSEVNEARKKLFTKSSPRETSSSESHLPTMLWWNYM